jgi:hypothetical protein
MALIFNRRLVYRYQRQVGAVYSLWAMNELGIRRNVLYRLHFITAQSDNPVTILIV